MSLPLDAPPSTQDPDSKAEAASAPSLDVREVAPEPAPLLVKRGRGRPHKNKKEIETSGQRIYPHLNEHSSSSTSSSTRGLESCPICCEVIVEANETLEGQEALLCEGTCQKWLHRWCAGVHKENFRDLASSDKPFICPLCSLAEHRLLITTLLETVQSLKEEIKQLKGERLVQLSAKNSNSEASYQVCSEAPFESLPTPQENKSEPWYNVTRKDKRDGKGRERNTKMRGNGSGVQSTSISGASALNVAAIHERPTRKHPGPRWLSVNSLKPQKQTQSEPTAGQVEPKCPSEEVPGVRRVWGTMRNCSNRTVLTVLQRLSTVSEKVEIRRKFKKKGDNRVQWWFLIRAEETVLQQLEQEWELVQTQTSWKLERCHKPATEQTSTVNGHPDVSSSFFLSQN